MSKYSKYHSKCTESDVPPKKIKKAPRDDTGLLAMINSDKPCFCEVMSRALKDDVPKNIGLSGRRATLQLGPDDVLGNPSDNLPESSGTAKKTKK